MRVRLFQLDGKLPNLALMRLASYHRARGDVVEFRKAEAPAQLEQGFWDEAPELVYASAIFERSRPLAARVLQLYPEAIVGGSGWDIGSRLPPEVEACAPDYSDHPTFRQSIGFSQRGCRLRCPFCIVPRKEGPIRSDTAIENIWRGDPHPREIVLLDNDFFGQTDWSDRIEEMRRGSFKVNFSQGINARLLTTETAAALASVDYRNVTMQRRQIYTAWDNAKDGKRLMRGLQLLVDAGIPPRDIMVYMLVGYWDGETHESRDYRRRELRDFGAVPYPMPFERTPELVGYQRWVVGAYDKRIPWSEWQSANYRPEGLTRPEQLKLDES